MLVVFPSQAVIALLEPIQARYAALAAAGFAEVRAILRAGVFELLERLDVPAPVVINEYIDIAHAFFSEDEPRVVNGILDKVARWQRPREFVEKRQDGKGR